jgi:hypothetical protein
MCQKTNLTKTFFVLLSHPLHTPKPLVLTVLQKKPHVEQIFQEASANGQTFLWPSQLKSLLANQPQGTRASLLPIQIPRDWFLH